MPTIILTHAYAETFSSSLVWVVTHNLGTSAPVTDCFTGGSPDEKIMPVSVVATDNNTVTITWSSARAGRVYVV
jgi:hypothetical protein